MPMGEATVHVTFSLDGTQLLITTSELARIYNTGNWKYYDLEPK